MFAIIVISLPKPLRPTKLSFPGLHPQPSPRPSHGPLQLAKARGVERLAAKIAVGLRDPVLNYLVAAGMYTLAKLDTSKSSHNSAYTKRLSI